MTAYERASVHEKDLRVMLALINRFPNSMDTDAAVRDARRSSRGISLDIDISTPGVHAQCCFPIASLLEGKPWMIRGRAPVPLPAFFIVLLPVPVSFLL